MHGLAALLAASAITLAGPATAAGVILFPPAGSNSFIQLFEIDSGQHICQPECTLQSSSTPSVSLSPTTFQNGLNVITASGSTGAGALHAFASGNTAIEYDLAMQDTYTVHGATGPVPITATMNVDGTMSTINVGITNILLAGSVKAIIGDFNIDPAQVFEPIVSPLASVSTPGVTLVGAPQSSPVNLAVSYTRMVNPGDVFDLGYELTLGYAEGTVDLSNTALIGFTLPNGVFLTDSFGNVFGAPTTGGGVPEPVSWALMIVGFGATGALARRRRRYVRAAFSA